MIKTLAGRMCWLVFATALTACGGGGGDGGNSSGSGASGGTTPVTTVTGYPMSLLLGNAATLLLSVASNTSTSAVSLVLVSPVAAPLVVAGNNTLATAYRPATFPGAGIACVSGPGNTIGTLTGVNTGVNVKSAAVLLDGTWGQPASAATAWQMLGASNAVFDGWENCGAKPEGAPSASSTLTIAANGSFTDNVFDGNPSTTVSIVNRSYTSAQAAAMLSPQGYLDSTQPANPTTVYLHIYQNAAGQTVLEEQGIPVSGASTANPGYAAIYFRR